jgi:HK97 family phage portal protein
MGLLANKLGIHALSLEDPAQPLLPYSALIESLGLGRSDAGVMVNEKQAMRLTTAFACITVISSDLASLTRSIFQRMPDGTVREALDHPYFELLHTAPNDTMTPAVFWGALIASALGWGNGYAYIKRSKGAKALSLTPLPSDKTTPVLVEGKLWYATTATKDGMPSYLDPEFVIHLPGLSFDGYVGMSPIQTCKNAFGLAIAAEKFGAQFFGNGARSTGVLTHPASLGTEAYENLKKSLREIMTGDNALRPFLLEEGMKWEQVSVAPNDAQFLETRKFQRSEIAALYRVPLHLLQDLERSTNNNIEHQALDYIRYALRPWAVRIEQEVNRKLLGGAYYYEHDFNDFQRGDFKSLTEGFTALRAAGAYSVNDILRAMRKNPISAEEGGDVRLAPLNTVNLASMVNVEANQPGAAGEADDDSESNADDAPAVTDVRRERILSIYRRLVRDAVGRVVNRKERDEMFAYKAFQPILSAMAESILMIQVSAPAQLNEDDELKVQRHANAIAKDSLTWKAAEASETATRITNEAYDALLAALIG